MILGTDPFSVLRGHLRAWGPCPGSIEYLDARYSESTVQEAFDDIAVVRDHPDLVPEWPSWTLAQSLQHNEKFQDDWRNALINHAVLDHPRRLARVRNIAADHPRGIAPNELDRYDAALGIGGATHEEVGLVRGCFTSSRSDRTRSFTACSEASPTGSGREPSKQT